MNGMLGPRLAAPLHRLSNKQSVDRYDLYDVPFNQLMRDDALQRILRRDRADTFAYVVTPNVDHVVRLHSSMSDLRRHYEEAWLSLCDSAVLAILARMAGARLPVVIGSDLVGLLLACLDPSERLLVIGCQSHDIEALRCQYGLTNIIHYNPPMGFIDDPVQVQACVDFVVAHPARFIFLVVGSPQQEIVANHLYHCGKAKGLGLCVGSSLRFLSGAERRAPRILRGSGFEWLFRLAQDPRRLCRRYLVRDPIIFRIAARYAFMSALQAGRGLVARSMMRRQPGRH
jgi:N-acetylglucosaminyldiphosphoundecaprenol N-acetyl-beta-D-mannosaminyltransferase